MADLLDLADAGSAACHVARRIRRQHEQDQERDDADADQSQESLENAPDEIAAIDPPPQGRIENIAERVTDQVEGERQHADGDARKEHQPGRRSRK